mgnify:FL=1
MRFFHAVLTSSRRAASTREATEAGIGSASLCIVFSRQPQGRLAALLQELCVSFQYQSDRFMCIFSVFKIRQFK